MISLIVAALGGSGGLVFALLKWVIPWAKSAIWNTGKYLPLRDSHVVTEAMGKDIRPEQLEMRLRYADAAKNNWKNLGLFAMAVFSLFSLFNWRTSHVIASKATEAKVAAETERDKAVFDKIVSDRQAMNDRATVENAKTAVSEWQVAYENLRASKEVIARQHDIVSVKREEVLKTKTAGQVRRAKSEAKRNIIDPIDVDQWMSIQAFGGDASPSGGSISGTDASSNINP